MDALEQARAEIDTVDAQLAALFERRMAAVLQVAEYKRAHGLPIYDATRRIATTAELGKPVPVDPSFLRAGDIEAVRRATSELVALVLNPAGTREEFSGQVADAQARLFNAVSALEKGTKNHILIQTRSESNIRMAEYTEILASSKAAGNGSPAEPTPAP